MKLRTALHIFLVLLLALLSVVAFLHRQDSLAQIQTGLQGLDIYTAALLFMGICILAALVMFPVSPLMIFSGACFGLWPGFVMNLLGFICGATAAFLTSRYLARDQITRVLPPKVLKVIDTLGSNGWKTVAVLRAIGIVPGVLVNYALGITAMPLRTYLWASLVFTMPNDFILTYAGYAGEEFIHNGDMGKLLMAVSLIALTVIVSYRLRHRFIKQ